MSKPRHSWSEEKKNNFTVVQQCIKCNLYRFMALNMWMYSHEEVTNDNPFVDTVGNDGCGLTKKSSILTNEGVAG